jgi:hypothetical protein
MLFGYFANSGEVRRYVKECIFLGGFMSFKIEGQLINLRPTVFIDINDYERWNNPDVKAWQYDGPWYNDDLSVLIAGRSWYRYL